MSSRPAPDSSSTISLSGQSSGPVPPVWEDDAWGIDSDDDEFVKANNGRGRGNAGPSGMSKQKHAPPARPHPFPLSGEVKRGASSSSVPRASGEVRPQPLAGAEGSKRTSGAGSWMFVERSGSMPRASPTLSAAEGVASSSALEPGEDGGLTTDNQKPRARRRTVGEGEGEVVDIRDALQSDLDRVLQGESCLVEH